MPQFTPSSVHSATVTFANPKSAGFDYTASFCMGTDITEVASASFHLDAGQSKAVAFSVTMPVTPGTYPVYIVAFSGGKTLAPLYKATEDVVIAGPAAPFQFSSVSAQRVVLTVAPAWATIVFHCTITNPNAQSATERIHVFVDRWDNINKRWYAGDPAELGYFDRTLASGASSVFTWDGNTANSGVVGGYGFGPMLSINTTCHMWLQDDLGNKSAEGVA